MLGLGIRGTSENKAPASSPLKNACVVGDDQEVVGEYLMVRSAEFLEKVPWTGRKNFPLGSEGRRELYRIYNC